MKKTASIRKEDLIRDLQGCDGVIMRVAGLDADVLSANPQLKAVGKHGVGVDSIDLDYCRAHQFEPQIAATTMDMTVIYDRVVRNGWVGISADMPNSPLDFPGVALVPFPIQEFPWQLDLIFPRGRPRSPQEQLIREAFPRLLR